MSIKSEGLSPSSITGNGECLSTSSFVQIISIRVFEFLNHLEIRALSGLNWYDERKCLKIKEIQSVFIDTERIVREAGENSLPPLENVYECRPPRGLLLPT